MVLCNPVVQTSITVCDGKFLSVSLHPSMYIAKFSIVNNGG